ncbi:MAG TPA: Gfo/Idh/MocA family oxidoreductase, partial [Chloroflexia bacterium]|nr:Gfo/Idh/MocA family oxidoreductase [Chloroflexia bacterium]
MTKKKREERTVRLGIIGAGLAIKLLHWSPLSRMPERFSVVAVADIDANAAQEVAGLASGCRSTTDYHELLASEDVE